MTKALLLWCLAAAPIVWLYMLRGRQNRQVAAWWLWQQTIQRKRKWRRWQRQVSLLLQLALLTMLVAAFAYPLYRPAEGEARSVVIVIDVSASMGATDVKPTRLDHALKEAELLVASLAPRDRMAALAAGESPRLLVPLTRNRQPLAAHLSALQATRETADLADAIRAAKEMLAGVPNGEVWVLTDSSADELATWSQQPDIRLRVVGGNAANASIIRLAARPMLDDPAVQEVFCTVRNTSARPVEARLGTGGLPEEAPVTFSIAAGKTASHLARFPVTHDGTLSAELHEPDDLEADNRAEVALHTSRKRTVFLIGPNYPPVARALEAVPGCEVRVVETVPVETPKASVAVYYQAVPESLPSIPCWFIEPRRESKFWEYAGVFTPRPPIRTEIGLTALANAELESAVIEQSVRLRPNRGAEILIASSASEPLAWRLEQSGKRIAVFQPILSRSDLALRPELPVLAAETIGWLANEKDFFHPTFSGDLLPAEESDLSRRSEIVSAPMPEPAKPPGAPWISWLLLFICAALVAEWRMFHSRVTI